MRVASDLAALWHGLVFVTLVDTVSLLVEILVVLPDVPYAGT